ncbi:DUF1382 family protein [Pseudomonas sp. PNPG3]|uniref:DUF1382 family protein n=1 Tax=Pseudomonas sp. PNPG3 TaxID=2919497 RepID=UPI001FFD9A81|nr:DUF1382 family protein [Pseudomonas sp. PNPG3]MCK2122073.1 DUF1382 family protein [Pseudomonas sp. PNPG3]
MKQAHPILLRTSLGAAEAMAKMGVEFVPMPILGATDHCELADQMLERLKTLATAEEASAILAGETATPLPVGLAKVRALAEAARANPYDGVALNDYGTAMAPAVTIDMIDLISQLQAEVMALRPDAERYHWIRDQKPCSFHLERNADNSVSRMTATEWIDDTPEQFDDTPAEHIIKMKEADTIWRLQIYPGTPITSGSLSRSTLDDVVDAARGFFPVQTAPGELSPQSTLEPEPTRYGTNSGHGHVWARPDGLKAKCGGPGLCGACTSDIHVAERAAPGSTRIGSEPAIKAIEVWTEGYAVTGNRSPAQRLGVYQAATFDDAVAQHLQTLDAKEQSFYRRSEDGEWRCWGCRLFDNEAAARKSFG